MIKTFAKPEALTRRPLYPTTSSTLERKVRKKIGKEVKLVRQDQRVGSSAVPFGSYNMKRRKMKNMGRKPKQEV